MWEGSIEEMDYKREVREREYVQVYVGVEGEDRSAGE